MTVLACITGGLGLVALVFLAAEAHGKYVDGLGPYREQRRAGATPEAAQAAAAPFASNQHGALETTRFGRAIARLIRLVEEHKPLRA